MGIREAKAHFSDLVRRARAGESIEITDRGRPVAAIVPLDAAGDEYERSVRDLLRIGAIAAPPPARRMRLPPLVRLKKGVDVLKMLREDRDAGP